MNISSLLFRSGRTLLAALALTVAAVAPASAATPKHIFIIVLENQNYATTFGSNSAAPYLSQKLVAQGALLRQYYGIGHNSLDNYIALVSGQAPNPQTQADCVDYSEWVGDTRLYDYGQVGGIGGGCVYPTTALTVANQLQASGYTWKAYMEDMGNDLTRDGSAVCAHPNLEYPDATQKATAADGYAVRHNPFMYFHAIIDDVLHCNANVVNLSKLDSDLESKDTTANYNFIVPNLCNDGHDATCADGTTGGLARVDAWLKVVVPKITSSEAFKKDGLLLITFDEAENDASACCHEKPGPLAAAPGIYGPGGGRVGAVALSPFIKGGAVSDVEYNHYSTLRYIEGLFGLDYLGFASDNNLNTFGKDLFGNN